MQPPENASDWFRIQNSVEDSDSTDVFVFDSIGGWFGLYADEFIEQLSGVTTSKINLRLNSPGGSVFEGITIANALRAHPANVTVYVDGLAASIASVIMLAGDRVVMRPQSQVMIHAASGGCYGDSTDMIKMAEVLEFQTRNIAEAYAERTGRSVDEFLDLMAAETWFTAKEAVAMGLADEAMPMKPKQDAEPASADARMHQSWDLSMYRYAGREQAPAPKVPAPVAMAGQVITAQTLGTHQLSTETLTNLATTPEPLADAATGVDDTLLNTLRELVRSAVREEIADHFAPTELVVSGLDPVAETPQPDDSPAAETPAPEDAFPPPDEDEEEDDEDAPPDEEGDAPTDQADTWDSMVGLLHATSPSADDVFAQLKEGWI
jgi:ATP-dependent Clp endopeptidase proteolytic subunit ClpP